MTFIKILFLFFPFLFLFTTHNVEAQIDHWEAIVLASEIWKYEPGSNAIDDGWRDANFNDTDWDESFGGFGYGDEDDQTIINPGTSLFLRKTFNIVDIDQLEAVRLYADFDDGFVAWINGEEVGRFGLSDVYPEFDQFAEEHEAELYQGGQPEIYNVPLDLLGNGENTIAIQVHNTTANSSDMSANFFVLAGINLEEEIYQPVPDWFESQVVSDFESSNLPLLQIDSQGEYIGADESIVANLGITYNGEGNLNYLTDPPNEYSGDINIKIRGQSSQWFDKKSYKIETVDAFGEDIDTSFLNFPTEEDWILHGPFSDKTLLRNDLSMYLANAMGQYASRTRLCELLINGTYLGVYVIMENIKRDKKRVDIAKLKEEDVEGVELTGGYIYRKDHGENDLFTVNGIGYQMVYPKIEEIQPQQINYLKSYIDSFELAVSHPSYRYAGKRYNEYINLYSFVETFILNEFSKNVDGYRLSSYFHKRKDSNGGLLYAGPAWDFNLSLRNADYCGTQYPQIWMLDEGCGDIPFWWYRMLEDEVFREALSCRWEDLRETSYHQDSIFSYIDEKVALLGQAQVRNFQQWDNLGEYLWPNPSPFATTYEEEISQMKNWISARLIWMDNNIDGMCAPTETNDPIAPTYLSISPNPFSNFLNVTLKLGSKNSIFTLKNSLGQIVFEQPTNHQQGIIQINIPTDRLTNGIYFACVQTEETCIIQEVIKM